MSVRVRGVELRVLNMRTRMPFKYGIATLTALPHLVVRADVQFGLTGQTGIAADGLPPKWFTKNPATTFAQDLAEMIDVIRSACAIARDVGEAPSVFQWWKRVYDAQAQWAGERGLAPLLANFGVSLIERAVIDAHCRSCGQTFADAVRTNTLRIRLGEIHRELADAEPRDFLPQAPLRSLIARHTIGLDDPLTDAEIPVENRVDDGLPQSLESAIRAYGLTHFKVKLSGKIDRDVQRLRDLQSLLSRAAPDAKLTLDGNENFASLESFVAFWRMLVGQVELKTFLRRVIFVEQPLHRDVALSEQTCEALRGWSERPPMIVDESDGELSSVPQALAGGYVGASHKNCKGIFKGIANASLIRHRGAPGGAKLVISGEDLSNVGPIALLEDLAVLATLGIEHAERNGHHYFRGLSAFSRQIQEQTVAAHPDLYRFSERGFATVIIGSGKMSLASVVDAPFGVGFELDTSELTPLEKWHVSSLDE